MVEGVFCFVLSSKLHLQEFFCFGFLHASDLYWPKSTARLLCIPVLFLNSLTYSNIYIIRRRLNWRFDSFPVNWGNAAWGLTSTTCMKSETPCQLIQRRMMKSALISAHPVDTIEKWIFTPCWLGGHRVSLPVDSVDVDAHSLSVDSVFLLRVASLCLRWTEPIQAYITI